MCLVLVKILMGIETSSERCRGETVRVWTNVGGESALSKQAGRKMDHNAIVHLTWLIASQIGAGLFSNRVPILQNIPDGATRPTQEVAMTS